MKPKKLTARSIVAQTDKIVAVTAYDYAFAKIADSAGVDLILIGDSLGMVVQGKSTTLSVTLDEIVYHTRCVVAGVSRALVVADMPFLTFHTTTERAIDAAGRCIQIGGADAVKIEGGVKRAKIIKAISDAEIPVLGHIGLTPQSFLKMGGFRVQGRTNAASEASFGESSRTELIEDALAVQEAGAFGVVIEGVPADVGAEITERLLIPTIGIGAGHQCRGQILVLQDLLGLSERSPEFAKRYADLSGTATSAIATFCDEVRASLFPDSEHSY